ncbi:unnamed protein product [Mytilus coruscus]|uniref:Uncharacterized protein n=1 Tax=Mytilus coruscus TaxID=42192 RepID=A0A6J8BJ23_MYTCO|nr:unnamed protein product [Mytilus coruscus]
MTIKGPGCTQENKESDELKKHESDEDLELRIKLLEEEKQRLKRDQLNKRIKELEAEVDGMSKLEEKPKKKSKKSKGEITLTNLRANDKLNKDVNDEMKRLGLDFDTNFSGQSELAETSKDKNVKFKSEKVTSEQELLQQLKKLNLAKGSVSKTNQHRRKHSDSKSQKVVQLPESVLRGNSSTESESETSSTSSSDDSSDYELSAKLSSKKKSKKLKSGLKIKSADKYEYVSKDLEFKQLNFKMLVAGELEIINNFCKNKSEKQGRLKLLQKIAYFSFIYHWASVLEFYAAWLRLIELGRKTWSDDSQMLENVMLSGQSLPKEKDQCKLCIAVFEVILPEQNSLLNLHNSFIGVSGYNFDLFKVPVYSKLCIKFWRQELCDYEDQEVCDMLEFGWPLGFDRKFEEFENNKIAKNHSGARDFAKDIDKYIKKEVGYGAVLGPFASNPFNDHLVISPLNSVPKANSEERRVIMDLSFPKGKSVNDGIDKNVYLGKHVELHYPNVDNFIENIKEKTVTNAVRFIAKNHDISLINYLDDFAGAEISEKADISYKKLKWVLDSCGLEESVEKASRPSHRMSFLGVWFDTEKMTMEVTPDRLVEIFDLVSLGKFLEIYNGVSLLNLQEWTEPDEYMASDACLVGCGGVSNEQFFHCVFPDFIVQQNLHINALELLSVIVCLKLWGQKGRKICIQCDNMVSVQVINQRKSRSRFLQACLREICFICAIKECELRAIHIDGIDNRLPDMLSRWSLSDIYPIQFYKSIEGRNFQHINVDSNFSDSVTIGELSLSVDLHMLRTQAQESLKICTCIRN